MPSNFIYLFRLAIPFFSIPVHFSTFFPDKRLIISTYQYIDMIPQLLDMDTITILAVLKAFKQKVDITLYDAKAYCDISKVFKKK